MYDRWEYMHGFGPGYGWGLPGGLLLGLLVVLPIWLIFSKAGFSGWWSLLMLVPGLNVVVLYVLAFADWPALHGAGPGPGRSSRTGNFS